MFRSTWSVYWLPGAASKGSGVALSFTYTLPSPSPKKRPGSGMLPSATLLPATAGFGRLVGTRPVSVASGTNLTYRQHGFAFVLHVLYVPPSPVV